MNRSTFSNVTNPNKIEKVEEDCLETILWFEVTTGVMDYCMFEAAKHAALAKKPAFFFFNDSLIRIYIMVDSNEEIEFKVYQNSREEKDWSDILNKKLDGIDWVSIRKFQSLP